MEVEKGKNGNLITLIVEIILTVSICLGIAYNSFGEIGVQADNYSTEVENSYNTLTRNYIRSFQVLKMESEEKIKMDLSFDEMQSWLLTKDDVYRKAIGEDVYDGFAFTYKGGYVHSWNYGDYSKYDPKARPWYQTADKANGEVALVAPYVTYLSNTTLIKDYDILRMSIVQKYNDEIFFDFDLNVHEINALLAEKTRLYDGTFASLYDKDGYILSSTDEHLYGHNINTPDKQISKEMSNAFKGKGNILKLETVDGSLKLIYKHVGEDNRTLCMLIPFGEVFVNKFMLVLFIALILILIEVIFYRQNKKHLKYLQEANNTKTEFLSRMSHELRTPLNALTGYATLLRDDIISDTPNKDKQLENISYIDRATNYLLRIISDILNIQNITFNKTQIKKEPINVESFMNNIVEMVRVEADEKDIDFSYERLTKLNDAYLIDGVRFQQILLNVLHNAVKFTPSGGKVKFTAQGTAGDDNITTIVIKVSDTGIGMSQEFIDTRLFTNFAQENQSIDSPYEGCGIGLFVSKEVIELMNGKIECSSEKGKGSTFTVTIPAEPVEVKSRRRTRRSNSSADYQLPGIKVLMCEDNPMNQDMEKRILEKMQCQVEIADDGEIGLQKFKESKPGEYDIILMDIRMPNLDGWETTKAIRALEREDAKDIPIVAVSANAFDEDVETSVASGMNEHLSKPVNALVLYDKIKKYCC